MAYNLGQIDPEERTDVYTEPREEAYPRPRTRVLRVAAALVVMGVFAGGLWFAYVEGQRHSAASGDSGDVPLIRADNAPMKVKPANPGGMQIPDRDLLIYGQQRPQVEHLLPPPEQPMARPSAPPPSPKPTTPQMPAPAGAAPGAPLAAPPADAAAGSAPGPQNVRGASPPDSGQPRLTSAAAEAARELAPSAASSKSQPAHGAQTKTSGLRLQLGSVRSESEARGTWDRLKHQNADLLGHLSGTAIRADLGDKGVYYRIQAGPVADASAADRICGELRQRGLGCIIVR